MQDHRRYWAAIAQIDGGTLEAVARLFDRPAWHAEAACRGAGVGSFFVELGGGDYEGALRLCAGCPVAAECREAGRDERAGLWGGLTPRQRRAQRRTAA